jgi:hypothetical protein
MEACNQGHCRFYLICIHVTTVVTTPLFSAVSNYPMILIKSLSNDNNTSN